MNICLWVFMCAMRCTIWEVWMNSNNLLLLWLCQTNCSPERDFKLVWFWERFADSLTQITKHQHSEKSMDICCLFTTGSQFLMSSSIFNYNSQLRCYTINHIINCSFHVKKKTVSYAHGTIIYFNIWPMLQQAVLLYMSICIQYIIRCIIRGSHPESNSSYSLWQHI